MSGIDGAFRSGLSGRAQVWDTDAVACRAADGVTLQMSFPSDNSARHILFRILWGSRTEQLRRWIVL